MQQITENVSGAVPANSGQKFVISLFFEGYLRKKGGNNSRLRRRWFKLRRTELVCFKSQQDHTPIDSLPLVGKAIVLYSKKPNGFAIQTHPNSTLPFRQWLLVAPSQALQQQWVDALNARISEINASQK